LRQQVTSASSELARMTEAGVVVEKMVRLKGQVTDETVDQALSELAVMETYPDVIVIGGPGNSLMVHGGAEVRGFNLERTVRMRKSENGQSEKWEVRYHMENPKRITMAEK
jgi:hypothetical protein